MQVDLLGTGSADRWPNPWCSCERCTWARSAGIHRARTSALVDDILLIDPGPDAGGGGVDFSRVRAVVVTHDHPDHLDPAFLLAWSWAGGRDLVVAGPPDALARCRDWVGPRAPVTFRDLAPGDELEVGHLRVRALPAAHSVLGGREHDGTALLYEVTGDARLLLATDTAALPHDHLGPAYDLVLLELTFGDRTDHGTAHLDLPSFGHEVAQLRAGERLAPGARVVAVHLSHHNPVDLPERLAVLGAEVVPDGSRLTAGTRPGGPGRRLLITGGARSGKSRRAETLLADRPRVTYLATAPTYPDDPEWLSRVAAHRRRRPDAWRLVETSAVADVLRDAQPDESVLVDCLTLWLTAVIDGVDAWEEPLRASSAMDRALAELLAALADTRADVILVTNEVGSGIAPATSSGRLFRDLLGTVNSAVAAACDDAEVVTAGIPRTLKGRTWTTST